MAKVSELMSNNIEWMKKNQQTWSIFYNMLEWGAKGDDVADDKGTLDKIIQELDGRNGMIIFPAGTYNIGSNLVIPENVYLFFVGEGLLSPASGVTITLNGGVIAGPFPIFSGEGAFEGKPQVDHGYSEWFGAVGDAITDDTRAISRTVSLFNNTTIIFLNRTYKVTNPNLLNPLNSTVYVAEGTLSQFLYNGQYYPIPISTSLFSNGDDKVVVSIKSNVKTIELTGNDLISMRGEFTTFDARLNTLIQGGGPDKDLEVVDIRTPASGYVPDGTILVAGDVTRDIQSKFVNLIADTAYHLKREKLANETDYTQAFQRLLNIARDKGSVNIYVADGEYRISSELRVYANTTITCSDSAVIKRNTSSTVIMFLNGERGNTSYAYGYSGEGNLHFVGGTYDLNSTEFPVIGTEYGSVAFGINHAHNVSFRNVRITNGTNNHYIDLCASKDVLIDNCRFDNMLVTGTQNYEVIQINAAIVGTFPAFGSIDYTVCDNVTIQNCLFENTFCGVGDHTTPLDASSNRIFQTNVFILNNLFKNVVYGAIRPQAFKHFVIAQNTIDGVTLAAAIRGFVCDDGEIEYNTIINVDEQHAITMWSQSTVFPNNISINNNRILDCNRHAININIKNGEIKNNYFNNIASQIININSCENIVIEGNQGYRMCTLNDNMYDAIDITNSVNTIVKDNVLDGLDEVNRMRYGVRNRSTSVNSLIMGNTIRNFASKDIQNDASIVTAGNSVAERMLTATITASMGIITLNSDITKYKYVIVATGVASGGGLRTEIARGWYNEGFRVGTDFVNVSTNNGKCVMSIDTPTQLTIVSTDDPVRYIIGVL